MRKNQILYLVVGIVIVIAAISYFRSRENFYTPLGIDVNTSGSLEGTKLDANTQTVQTFVNAAASYLGSDKMLRMYINKLFNYAFDTMYVNLGGMDVYFVQTEFVSIGDTQVMREGVEITSDEVAASNGTIFKKEGAKFIRIPVKISGYCGRSRVIIQKRPWYDVKFCVTPLYVEGIFCLTRDGNVQLCVCDVVDFGRLDVGGDDTNTVASTILNNKSTFLNALAESSNGLANSGQFAMDNVGNPTFMDVYRSSVLPYIF